jgi:hypothetical protein
MLHIEYGVLTAVNIKIYVTWDVTSYFDEHVSNLRRKLLPLFSFIKMLKTADTTQTLAPLYGTSRRQISEISNPKYPEIGTSSIEWVQLSRVILEDGDRIVSETLCCK